MIGKAGSSTPRARFVRDIWQISRFTCGDRFGKKSVRTGRATSPISPPGSYGPGRMVMKINGRRFSPFARWPENTTACNRFCFSHTLTGLLVFDMSSVIRFFQFFRLRRAENSTNGVRRLPAFRITLPRSGRSTTYSKNRGVPPFL